MISRRFKIQVTLEERVKNKKLKQSQLGEYTNPNLHLLVPTATESKYKSVSGVIFYFPNPSIPTTWKVKWTERGKPKELLLYTELQQCNNYLVVKGKVNNKVVNLYIHRLIYFSYYEETERLQVHHINRDTQDNSLQNLIALTEEEHSIIHNKSTHIPGTYKKLF